MNREPRSLHTGSDQVNNTGTTRGVLLVWGSAGRRDGRRRQDRQRYIRKNGAPLPVWFRSLACGSTVSGATAAYCFDIHTRRASRTTRLSAPEHHRYVRVLDWTVARESGKAMYGRGGCCLQVRADSEFIFIFNLCERLLGRVRALVDGVGF